MLWQPPRLEWLRHMLISEVAARIEILLKGPFLESSPVKVTAPFFSCRGSCVGLAMLNLTLCSWNGMNGLEIKDLKIPPSFYILNIDLYLFRDRLQLVKTHLHSPSDSLLFYKPQLFSLCFGNSLIKTAFTFYLTKFKQISSWGPAPDLLFLRAFTLGNLEL